MSKQKQKEPLSIMITKTVLAIAVFTGIGTIIFGGGVLIMKYYNSEVNNRIVKPVDQETENYYDVLEKKCAGDGCCLSSFKTMKANNYKKANENGKCPEGFYMDMLKCVTSYQWCVPMEKNCAKIGESVGTCVGCIEKCCQGLKPMVNLKYNGECVDLPAPGSGGVCSNCGNGICDDENNEDECNCPEDCGEEIDELLYCEKDNDCTVYFSHCDCEYHCANRNIEIVDCMVDCDETGPIISKCVCENNKCVESTSDWQTYRNEKYGFEFEYPKIGEYYGDEIKLFEKGNVIKLCTKDDMGREYNFCHSLEVFRISEGEIVKNAIKKIRIKDEDQSVCFVKEDQLYDDWNFKTYKIVDQTGAASPIGPCGYYGFELFAADPKNSQIFFLLPVIQDSFLDVEKWLKSFKFIES